MRPKQLFQPLVTLERFEKSAAGIFLGERFELAAIGGIETFAFGLGLGEVALKGFRIHGRVKVFEVPLRKRAEISRGLGLRARLRFGAKNTQGFAGALARHGTVQSCFVPCQ